MIDLPPGLIIDLEDLETSLLFVNAFKSIDEASNIGNASSQTKATPSMFSFILIRV